MQHKTENKSIQDVLKWQVFRIECGYLFSDLKRERGNLGCCWDWFQSTVGGSFFTKKNPKVAFRVSLEDDQHKTTFKISCYLLCSNNALFLLQAQPRRPSRNPQLALTTCPQPLPSRFHFSRPAWPLPFCFQSAAANHSRRRLFTKRREQPYSAQWRPKFFPTFKNIEYPNPKFWARP